MSDTVKCAGCDNEIEADSANVKHVAWYIGRPYHIGCYYRIPAIATVTKPSSVMRDKLAKRADG